LIRRSASARDVRAAITARRTPTAGCLIRMLALLDALNRRVLESAVMRALFPHDVARRNFLPQVVNLHP